MALREEIIALASVHSGSDSNGSEEADFLGAFGLAGDDASEFLDDFGAKFGVDFSEFRWEFHYIADEPPFFRRLLPIARDGQVIPFQPITLDDLARCAETRRWSYDYPDHVIRKSVRYDLALLVLFPIIILGSIALICL
ncbi:DUF1493 family protein [Ruegeria jejuensis]|uniref:DUF1493 family protein n=1 Tax=Ruegeria jejuensis TaxID=3233338 RepID=UPI00355BD9FC